MVANQLFGKSRAGDDANEDASRPALQRELEGVVADAWALRDTSPSAALDLVSTGLKVDARFDDELRLRVCAVRATALLSLDEPDAAKQEVLSGVEALEHLLQAGSDALAATGWTAVDAAAAVAVQTQPDRALDADEPGASANEHRLAARLARLPIAAIPTAIADVVTELLLVGLRSACMSNDIENALPFGKAALSTADHFQLPGLAARAHSDIASVYGMRQFDERAIEHLRAGIAVLEAAGEAVTPSLLNNLGNVYLSRERLDEALGCFERARDGFAQAGDTFRHGIAAANQGRALVGLRRHREGASALVDALRDFRELGRKAYVGTTLAKLGTCYSEMGEREASIVWFEAALKEFATGELPFESEVRQAYGAALLSFGRFERALSELERAEVCSRRDGATLAAFALLREQARALAALGRHEEAYGRLSRYLEQSDNRQAERGESMVSVMLSELESGLAADHELPALTSRVLTEANKALRIQAERLEHISTTDELTEQHNRRFLNRRLEEELRRAKGRDRVLSLILFDVDNFKSINDLYSHLVGDEVLRQVAATLRASFRHSDVVARWGGEEFAVLLPHTGHQPALAVADKARLAVASFDWATIGSGLAVTVSAGVASTSEVTGTDLGPGLLKLADSRLYRAKNAGRNRIAAG